jgi:hypothetical protein
MQEGSIHIWGFYDRDGNLRPPQDASYSKDAVYDHFCAIRTNLGRTNVEIDSLNVTRLIGGNFVGCTFDAITVVEGEPVKMWHCITRPQDPWPANPPGNGHH